MIVLRSTLVWAILATCWLSHGVATVAAERRAVLHNVTNLELHDGEMVAGELRGSPDPSVLRWQARGFITPFEFTLNQVQGVIFPSTGEHPEPEGEYCFELAGDDLLFGKLLGLTAEEARIEVPRLGVIHVRRESLHRMLRWRDGADLVYLGPKGLQEWDQTSTTARWREQMGHLVSRDAGASITSRFDLPRQVFLEFEISWSTSPDFVMAVAGSNASYKQAFRFEVWNDNLVLYRETDSEGDLVCIQYVKAGAGRAHLQVYMDCERGRAFVFSADGEPLGDLSVGGDQFPARPRILLVNRRGNVRLERLRIGRWDGERPQAVQANRSRIHLSDGSIVYGEVTGFDAAAGQFTVRSDDQELRFTADQVGGIVLSRADASPERTVRAVFKDGICLSGRLLKVEDEKAWLACPGVREPLGLPISHLRHLQVLDYTFPTPAEAERSGRLEMEGLTLGGHLVAGSKGAGVSCLAWHPDGSATASPLQSDAAARIVYRDPPPQSPQTQVNAPPTRVRGGGGLLGQLANALAGASARTTPTRQRSRFGPSMYLRTGDTIPCEVERIDERGVIFRSSMFDATFMAHDKIKAVELENQSRGVKIDRSKRDRLLTLPRMQRNNPPTHLIRSTAGDYLRARLNEMDDETLTAEVRLESRKLPRQYISQIIWLHNEASPEETAETADSTTVARVQALRDDGIRLTFSPDELVGFTLCGTSEVLGACRVDLTDVDQLLIGGAIEQAATDLAYQRWKLSSAVEPKWVTSDGAPASRTPGTESALVAKPAPDFELKLIDGEKFRLSDHKGSVVVLDFWATWCGPCMQTMPEVDRVVRSFHEKNVMLIAVNMQETTDAITKTLERIDLETTVALDPDGVVAGKYEVTAIPQTVIIDRQGNVVRLFIGGGSAYADQLQDALESVLENAEQASFEK